MCQMQVCKLLKSLYGLKQASKQWNSTLTTTLIKSVFTQSIADPSLFIKENNQSYIALTTYVDDIILASNSRKEIDEIKKHLNNYFSIKDLRKLKFILGLEVARNKKRHSSLSKEIHT